jgi:hypothetical protein
VNDGSFEPESWEDQRAGSHALVGKTLKRFGVVCSASGLLAEVAKAELQFLTARDVMVIGLVMALTGVWVGKSEGSDGPAAK